MASNNVFLQTDLREDKQFFMDHPGAVPIPTAQVNTALLQIDYFFVFIGLSLMHA